jgi:alkaline phosphatase D
MSLWLSFLVSVCLPVLSAGIRDPPRALTNSTKGTVKFAFGSCFRNWFYKDRYDIFSAIQAKSPDVFLWTGDAIYANKPHWLFGIKPVRFSLSEVDGFFTEMSSNERSFPVSSLDYQALTKQIATIGIWDDHDYGMHDGDSSFVDKHWFRERYLRFIGEDTQSKRSLDQQHGIFESYYLDKSKKVKVILLDIRFERTDEEDLGQTQIEWLSKEILEENNSDIFLIVTASPMIANDRVAGDSLRVRTREFIIELIEMKQKFFLIISGELHFAEFTQLGYSVSPGEANDLWEVVSSGLSHSVGYQPIINSFIMPSFNVAH